MQTIESNGAACLLDDYVSLEYILLGDLRALLEAPLDAGNARWLVAVVEALLDILPRQFALQDRGGSLADLVERCPGWSDQVDQLRIEREAVYTRLRVMRARLNQDGPRARANVAQLVEVLRSELRDWMVTLVAHHRHERQLVQNAFHVEVGAAH
ncbi:MAG TPA: hypothetical protein VML55_04280 [Planctomycetaceae bacterium]|nr:hypothetical protein [Planctomycetaceae bacterium]